MFACDLVSSSIACGAGPSVQVQVQFFLQEGVPSKAIIAKIKVPLFILLGIRVTNYNANILLSHSFQNFDRKSNWVDKHLIIFCLAAELFDRGILFGKCPNNMNRIETGR